MVMTRSAPETGAVARRLDAIEAKRTRLMAMIGALSPDVVAARPRPGKWSIRDIVEHLVLSEPAIFGDLAALAAKRRLERRPGDRVRYLAVMFVLRFDIPVRVPSPDLIPTGRGSLAELQGQWESNHHQLRAWVTASDRRELETPRFLHPIAGPMSAVQSLRMLEVHLDRHARQIKALIKRGSRTGS